MSKNKYTQIGQWTNSDVAFWIGNDENPWLVQLIDFHLEFDTDIERTVADDVIVIKSHGVISIEAGMPSANILSSSFNQLIVNIRESGRKDVLENYTDRVILTNCKRTFFALAFEELENIELSPVFITTEIQCDIRIEIKVKGV